jgi:RNA-directed DNA polymerase
MCVVDRAASCCDAAALHTQAQKATALVRPLKEVFRRHRSQPIERVIALINPVLRGWVNYFAVGHSGECVSFIKDWVEKKVRPSGARSETKGLRLGTME